MRPKREKANRAASFVLRIWWEEGGVKPIWRGRIQHAASGDSRYFQTIAELLDFVEQRAGRLSAEGGENSEIRDWGLEIRKQEEDHV